MSKQNQWIVGVNAVASAIENDADNVREVLVEGGSKNARLTEIEENARRKGIDVRRVTGQALDGVAGSLRHQGVAARYAAAKTWDEGELQGLVEATEGKALVRKNEYDALKETHTLAEAVLEKLRGQFKNLEAKSSQTAEELAARIKAMLRRSLKATSNVLTLGPLAIDFSAQAARLNGASMELTAFEYRVLEFLVRERARVVSKQELSDYLYPHDQDRDSNVLEVLIGRLRRKLDPDGTLEPIETLRGRGYRFRLE